jgi:thiamine pyrophosphate-dependent acetolactate synthase large subunit-like protein
MTRRTGARIVADMLDDCGVTHVFGAPAILRRTLAELERHHPRIDRVVTHGHDVDFARIAEEMGALGLRVDKRSADQASPYRSRS